MSFTAEVKDELSRCEDADPVCSLAELAAMVRVCGTLSVFGSGSKRRYRLSMATETGSVARTAIKLMRRTYGLTTELTVRRSVLHKTRNYLIVVPDQPQLPKALVRMGVLTPELGLARAIAPELVSRPAWAKAYLRGAFMGGGFISDPHGDAHFEMVAQGDAFATGLADMLARFDVNAHVSRRRSSFVIYLKNASDILSFLVLVGAPSSALAIEDARVVKSLRNDANRIVNAEIANQKKATDAAGSQTDLIELIDAKLGLGKLPPALRSFCELRLANPLLSLRELGEIADPPLSKSAVYHRVRRLEEIAAELDNE